MANEYGYFFDSSNGDRIYNAASFEDWLKPFYTSGVLQDQLQVTATSGMVVSVSTGYANVDGKVRNFETATQIILDAANSSNPRIDTVVVRRSDTDRQITIAYVKGDYSGDTPSPKAPVRENNVYELVLAQIYVGAGVTAVTTADITDTRPDSALCGWITGTIDQIDLSQILAQSTAEFNEWFATIQGILDSETAGHLQNEITALQGDVSDLQSATTITADTLLASGWSNGAYSFETDYPNANYNIEISLDGDLATDVQIDAWNGAQILGSATTNVYKAKGDVPTINIPIILKVVAKI